MPDPATDELWGVGCAAQPGSVIRNIILEFRANHLSIVCVLDWQRLGAAGG
jgi:hypothetical protein